MKKEYQGWVKAGILIAHDPKSLVKCPNCQHKYLEVEDIKMDCNLQLYERYLRCPNCKAWNVMRISNKSE